MWYSPFCSLRLLSLARNASGKQFCYMIFSPEEYNVHLCCPPDQSGWSSQVSSKCTSLHWFSPDWTFVWDTFFFPPSNPFLPREMSDLTMTPTLPPFLMSSQTSRNALPLPQGDSVSSFSYIIQQKQASFSLNGITMEYENKRDMMQCC